MVSMSSSSSSSLINKLFSLLLIVLSIAPQVKARTWKDIATLHEREYVNSVSHAWKAESDPLLFTESPTLSPTLLPSSTPTRNPTAAPTRLPSTSPTRTTSPTETAPTTKAPTLFPTSTPTTRPTSTPTASPTDDPYPENEEPLFPPRDYFNYNTDDNAKHGPGYPAIVRNEDNMFVAEYQNNGWKDWRPDSNYYWQEFTDYGWGAWRGTLEERNMFWNRCGNTGHQSPIDVRMSGVACVEHHQIRVRRGDHGVRSAGVDKQIQGNKLRLWYQRRPCGNPLHEACAEPDPPAADFPNGWGGFADTIHIDFKVPAEHRINGDIFDGEMQVYHIHPGRERLPTISVVMRAGEDTHNEDLQLILDTFQDEYDQNSAACASQRRNKNRYLSSMHSLFDKNSTTNAYDDLASQSNLNDDPDFVARKARNAREVNSRQWSPYSMKMMPSYYFYGYHGSLTEPPCTEIVSWFVMDKPMLVSFAQVEQMKRLIFTHVADDCRKTSIHFEQGVARPLQDSVGREVWHCTEEDFLPDHMNN